MKIPAWIPRRRKHIFRSCIVVYF